MMEIHIAQSAAILVWSVEFGYGALCLVRGMLTVDSWRIFIGATLSFHALANVIRFRLHGF